MLDIVAMFAPWGQLPHRVVRARTRVRVRGLDPLGRHEARTGEQQTWSNELRRANAQGFLWGSGLGMEIILGSAFHHSLL